MLVLVFSNKKDTLFVQQQEIIYGLDEHVI